MTISQIFEMENADAILNFENSGIIFLLKMQESFFFLRCRHIISLCHEPLYG